MLDTRHWTLLPLVLLAACGGSSSGSSGGAAGTGTPEVAFAAPSFMASEGAAPLALELVLNGTAGDDVEVTLSVSGVAATPSDAVLGSTTATIPAGQSSVAVALEIIDDGLFELEETLSVSILGATSSETIDVGTPATAQVTITDDDPAPSVAFVSSAAQADEAAAQVTLNIALSEVAGAVIEVPLTYGGTADAADFDDLPAAVTIPAGAQGMDLVLRPVNDGVAEGPETLDVTIARPSAGTIGGASTAVVTLVDAPATSAWGPILLQAGWREGSISWRRSLFHADPTTGTAVRITDPEQIVYTSRLSPDGAAVAFRGTIDSQTASILFVMEEGDAAPTALTVAPFWIGDFISWSPDGTRIAFVTAPFSVHGPGIWTVRRDGTDFVRVSPPELDALEPGQFVLDEGTPLIGWSPDSSRIAFTARQAGTNPGPDRLYVAMADGSSAVEVSAAVSGAVDIDPDQRWSPDGSRLAFTAGGDLYSVLPDGSDLVRLASDMPAAVSALDEPFQWNPAGGVIALQRDDPSTAFDPIEVVAADGGALTPLTPLGVDTVRIWSWSPDGTALAFASVVGVGNRFGVQVVPAAGGDLALLSDVFDGRTPVWSPDSARVAFSATNPAGTAGFYVAPRDGSSLTLVSDDNGVVSAVPVPVNPDKTSWSPDGQRIAYRGTVTGSAPGGATIGSNSVGGGNAVTHFGPGPVSGEVAAGRPVWDRSGEYVIFTTAPVNSPANPSRVYAERADGAAPRIEIRGGGVQGFRSIDRVMVR